MRIEIPLFLLGIMVVVAGILGAGVLWHRAEQHYAGRAVGVYETSETGTIRHKGRERGCHSPVVLFEANGQTQRGVAPCMLSVRWAYRERVRIRYSPSNPTEILPDTIGALHTDHIELGLLVGGLGTALACAALLIAIRRRINNPVL